MRHWGISVLLTLSLTTPAQAQSLSNLLGSMLSGACGNTLVTAIFNVKGACELYQALQPGFNAEGFLKYATNTLLSSAVSGALKGVGDATNNAFLNNLSSTLGSIANGIREAYNLPYRVVDGLAQGVFGEVYNQIYSGFSETYSSIFSTASKGVESSYSVPSFSLNNPSPDSVSKAYGDLGISAPEGYDFNTLSSLSNAVSNTVSNLNSLAQENKSTIISLAKTGITELALAEQAAFQAEQARQQAQEAAERAMRAGVAKATAEREAELARQTIQLGVDNPTGGEKSLATKYKERAQNAISDRELLQLQVEAIADSMANQALNNQLLAEYLRSVAQEQVMSTDAIRNEVRALREAIEGPMMSLGSSAKERAARFKQLAEEAEAIHQSALRQIEPAISALNTVCLVYGVGECKPNSNSDKAEKAEEKSRNPHG